MKTKLLFVLAIGLVACSSITTTYDYDKTVDFTKYKTYNFTPEALKLGIQELNRDRLLAAIDKAVAGTVLQRNPPLPAKIVRNSLSVWLGLANLLGLQCNGRIAWQILTVRQVRSVERSFYQSGGKTGAIEKKISFDLFTIAHGK